MGSVVVLNSGQTDNLATASIDVEQAYSRQEPADRPAIRAKSLPSNSFTSFGKNGMGVFPATTS